VKKSDSKPTFITQEKIDRLLKRFEENRTDNHNPPEAESKKADRIPKNELKPETSDPEMAVSRNKVKNALADTDNFKNPKEKIEIKEQLFRKKWSSSNQAVIFLIIAVAVFMLSISTFIAFNHAPNRPLQPGTGKASSDSIPSTPTAPNAIEKKFRVDFKDFIVLAPASREDFTFTKIDIQVECINERTADEMNKHNPLIRSVIHDAIKNDPAFGESASIDPVKLKTSIVTVLKSSIPGISENHIKNITIQKLDRI